MENQTQVKTKFKVIGVFFGNHEVSQEELRCLKCGKLLLIHNGKIEDIHFYAPKTEMGNSLDVLCPRCKVIYRLILPETNGI